MLGRRCLDLREQRVLIGCDAGDQPVVGRLGFGVGFDPDSAGQVVEPVSESRAAQSGRDGRVAAPVPGVRVG